MEDKRKILIKYGKQISIILYCYFHTSEFNEMIYNVFVTSYTYWSNYFPIIQLMLCPCLYCKIIVNALGIKKSVCKTLY